MLGLAKKKRVEMAWGRRTEQICSASILGREQAASYQTRAEEAWVENEGNHGSTCHNVHNP